ncbi:MAG: membrane protein insertion efficiency factor YidD [Planctomycetota bacterium]
MIRGLWFVVVACRELAVLAVLATVRTYQALLSPWLPRSCRYSPTCSEYAKLAVRRYGPLVGGWKAVCRIARCHPWSAGGWDPP